jgi:hypothetical protein
MAHPGRRTEAIAASNPPASTGVQTLEKGSKDCHLLPLFGTPGAPPWRGAWRLKSIKSRSLGHDLCGLRPSRRRGGIGAAQSATWIPPDVHYPERTALPRFPGGPGVSRPSVLVRAASVDSAMPESVSCDRRRTRPPSRTNWWPGRVASFVLDESYIRTLRSGDRYPTASAMCWGWISPEPSSSARVGAARRTLSCARADNPSSSLARGVPGTRELRGH